MVGAQGLPACAEMHSPALRSCPLLQQYLLIFCLLRFWCVVAGVVCLTALIPGKSAPHALALFWLYLDFRGAHLIRSLVYYRCPLAHGRKFARQPLRWGRIKRGRKGRQTGIQG